MCGACCVIRDGGADAISASDLVPRPVYLLEHPRLVPAHFSAAHTKSQVATFVHLDFIGTFNRELDAARIGSRRDNEIVFELPVVAVIDQIDARIDLTVPYCGKGGNIRAPKRRIVADEIIELAGQLFAAADRGVWISADQLHAQD